MPDDRGVCVTHGCCSAVPAAGATAASQSHPSTLLPLVSATTASAAATVYRRREPTATALYPIVQHHLESFLARASSADPFADAVPGWVEYDFRAYLRCGILAHGFARARCTDCGAERLVAFSCKGRGVCPSCNTRRMVEVAAHLSDQVLPPLPVRQWVFSLPKRLRPFLLRDPSLTGAVLRVLLRAIRTLLRKRCPGAPAHAQLGAVSFLHRFGSSLNPHFHFHIVILDGLFAEDDDGSIRFQWACLIARIYEVFPLSCPDCGAEMRILAFLTDPFTVGGILRHVGLPASPPPLTPARSPPDEPAYDADPLLDLDQTPAFDPTEPEAIPDFDFDQTLGA